MRYTVTLPQKNITKTKSVVVDYKNVLHFITQCSLSSNLVTQPVVSAKRM